MYSMIAIFSTAVYCILMLFRVNPKNSYHKEK